MGVPHRPERIIYHVEVARAEGGEYDAHTYEKHEYYGLDRREALRVVEHTPMLDRMEWTVTVKAHGVNAARQVLLALAEKETDDAV